MNSVLVTGSSGFTAYFLIDYLLKKNKDLEIVAVDRDNNTVIKNKFRAKFKIKYYRDDLQRQSRLNQIIEKHKPQQIYHLVGVFRAKNLREYLESNILTSLHLLRAVQQIKNYNPQILLIGSAAEYGKGQKYCLQETEPLRPVNDYGWVKKSQTKLGEHFSQNYGLNVNMARTFNLIGPGISKKLLVGNIMEQIRKNSGKIRTVEIDNMMVERDFLDVRDAVRAYYKINSKKIKGEVFNICSGKKVSLRKLSEIIQVEAEKVDFKVVFKENKKNIHPIKISYGSNAKARKMLDWQPEINLVDSIKFILEQELNVRKN